MSNRANRRKEKRELEPKRRFPEFRDAGKWEERKLGDFLLKKPDYGVNAPAVPYSDDLPAYLRITDISNEGYYLCDQKVSVKIEAKDENYLSEGDIVLARTGASVGKSYKYRKEDGNLVFAGFLIRIRPDPQKLDSTFLFNFLSTRQYWDWVSVNSARSGQPGINGNEYATLSVPVPSNKQKGNGLPEQQKIADCLTSIDDRITAETQKLDALKAHKKGLMQQLFPAEGKTQPKRRFPEFCDAGEWIRKSGDEITIKITKGSSPNWQGFSYKSQGVLFITSENVRDGFLDVSNPKYLPEKFYEKQKSSQLSHGDILINIVGASIGRSCSYLLNNKAFINQAVALFRVNRSTSFKFIGYYYQNDEIKREMFGTQSESARPNLSLTNLKNIEFYLPSFIEQQKIASCLSSLDELITAQIQKIATLQIHKKGLMQQLFPDLDEVKR